MSSRLVAGELGFGASASEELELAKKRRACHGWPKQPVVGSSDNIALQPGFDFCSTKNGKRAAVRKLHFKTRSIACLFALQLRGLA